MNNLLRVMSDQQMSCNYGKKPQPSAFFKCEVFSSSVVFDVTASVGFFYAKRYLLIFNVIFLFGIQVQYSVI